MEKLQPQLLEEEFNQKAQEIWIRQKLALTSSVPPSTIANAPTDRDEVNFDSHSLIKFYAFRNICFNW